MIGTIFLGGTARACQDQHAGRPAPSLGWPGERKSIGATSRGKRRFSLLLVCTWRKEISRAKVTGLGARAPRSLGPGSLLLRKALGPRLSLKSLLVGGRRRGGRRLKRLPRRWGPQGSREAGTGYPPHPPPRV